MPFSLAHKQSKGKLRRPAPSPLELPSNALPKGNAAEDHSSLEKSNPYPTPPQSADSAGFKMFNWRKKAPAPAPIPTPVYPTKAPQPILKARPEHGHRPPVSPSRIRFGESASSSTNTSPSPSNLSSSNISASSSPSMRTPRVTVSGCDDTARPIEHPPVAKAVPTSLQHKKSRRSSRPASPASTSFGARMPRTSPSNSSSSLTASPLSTPPMNGPHITTPPTVYVSTMQQRAPPPPSPYRPTTDQRRPVSSTFSRLIPDQTPSEAGTVQRPPRHSSLFAGDNRISMIRCQTPQNASDDPNVPQLNIIPATPQDNSEGFSENILTTPKAPARAETLEEAVTLSHSVAEYGDKVDERSKELDSPPPQANSPTLDVDLDFTPFQPLCALPESESSKTVSIPLMPPIPSVPAETTPQSTTPPFDSFPSLPSLSSSGSIPSSSSAASMPTSASSLSLMSFPDVEEALGSMLASLGETDFDLSQPIELEPKKSTPKADENPGLGLGLDLPSPPSITAPLTNLRKAPPPPLDMTRIKALKKANAAKEKDSASPGSAGRINHRVAFYGTAKAAPRSPSSGTFIDISRSSSPLSSLGSMSSISSQDEPLSYSQHSTVEHENDQSGIGLGLGFFPGETEGFRRPSLDRQASISSSGSDNLGMEEKYRDEESVELKGFDRMRLTRYRDSMSLTSEASDDDLHTASIISLTPVGGDRGRMVEVREELMLGQTGEVGLAI